MPSHVWQEWVIYLDHVGLPDDRADLRMGILAAAAEANAVALIDTLLAVNGEKPKKRTCRQAKDFMPTIWSELEKVLTEDEVVQINLDNRAKSKALMLAAAGPVRG